MEINNQIKERTKEIEKEISQMDQTKAMTTVFKEGKELTALLKEHQTIIHLGGNIGLGKTSTAELIGLYGRIEVVEEDVKNELLGWYYDNMKTYAERLQIDLISTRAQQIASKMKEFPQQSLIFDRTAYEELIFSKVLRDEKKMSEESYTFCKQYFSMKKKQVEKLESDTLEGKSLTPNLVIILKSSEDKGWERVLAREREIEVRDDADKGDGLPRDFYCALHNEYKHFESFLKDYYNGPILSLDQDSPEVGDSSNSKGQLYTVKAVKEALKIIYKPKEKKEEKEI